MRVVKYPHPALAYQCKPLRKIDQSIRDVVAEMFDLMYESNGVGLAANQVALPYQLIVVNPTGKREEKEKECVLINPVILKVKGNEEGEEGCLSYPGLQLIVPRAKQVKFQAIDLSGKPNVYFWEGFEARIIQHETDHLNGAPFFLRAVASSSDLEMALDQMKTDYEKGVLAGEEPSFEQWREEAKRLESEYAIID